MASQACVYINFWVSTMSTFDLSENQKISTAVYTFLCFSFGLVFGGILLGPILDKYGYRAALTFIFIEITIAGLFLIVQNEIHYFDWTAYITMFILGMIDNTVWSFINAVLGFEFQDWGKVVPFGTKTMVEQFTTGSLALVLTFYKAEGKQVFRILFITLMLLGQVSTIIMMFFKYT